MSDKCHPQTIALINTRAGAAGFEPVIGDIMTASFDDTYMGALVQVR